MTEIARCTSADGCPVHIGVRGVHSPWGLADPQEAFESLHILTQTLEGVINDGWDDDDSWESIASNWIEHMASTHGAHCPGRHCAATAEVPAHVGALRRMWRHHVMKVRPPAIAIRDQGYHDAIRDLAHELGVDLDG